MTLSPISARDLQEKSDLRPWTWFAHNSKVDQNRFLSVFNKRMATELGVKKLNDNILVQTFTSKAAELLNTYSSDYKRQLEKFLLQIHDGVWEGDVKTTTKIQENDFITPIEVELLSKIPSAQKVVKRTYFEGEPGTIETAYLSSYSDCGRALHIFNTLYIAAKHAAEEGKAEDSVYENYYQGCKDEECDERKGDFYSIADYEKYISK